VKPAKHGLTNSSKKNSTKTQNLIKKNKNNKATSQKHREFEKKKVWVTAYMNSSFFSPWFLRRCVMSFRIFYSK
jgi:hypothetical protein